jgi:hypothetical protein
VDKRVYSPLYDITKRRDFRVSVSAADPHVIYVYFGGFPSTNLDARFRVSTDAGANGSTEVWSRWIRRNSGTTPTSITHPTEAQTVYLGARDLFKSTDGGQSWSNLTHNFYDIGYGFQYAPGGAASHPDQHALAFSPGNPNEFYLGNDGGVSKTNR